MNYIDVYKRRASYLGTTPQDRAHNSGVIEFRRYLKYSRYTERGLIREKNNYCFDGVILTDKEDENRVSQILKVDLDTKLEIGDLILWNDEHWLIYRKTTSSYEPFQQFYMVRCNYYIKWVDNGVLKESWAYLLGTKDAKIIDNFRTWHNVITPQPNKNIKVIMPHQEIKIGAEIMVLDEVWHLIDYDQNSVPGIIYMSFTETNLNHQRDDLNDKIANVDKLAKWEIVVAETQTVSPRQPVPIKYHVLKNGEIVEINDNDLTITYSGHLYEKDGQIYTTASGQGYLYFSYNGAVATQEIIIDVQNSVSPLLVGDDKIRVGSKADYVLENVEDVVSFKISDTKLAKIKRKGNNSCTVIANEENELGSITLIATIGDNVYEKVIGIIPLWQVM